MAFKKKIAVFAVLLFVLISVIVFAATNYPYALISFDGITMITNNSTTQGFIDITLKNINTTGVTFCLRYDTNYIELSDVETNIPIQNPQSAGDMLNMFNTEHKYFDQNTEIFPDNIFIDTDMTGQPFYGTTSTIGVADQDSKKQMGHLSMSFLPVENAITMAPDYIENVVEDRVTYPVIKADVKDGLKLGRLSFNIKNPAEFSKLTESELNNIIEIVPVFDMIEFPDGMEPTQPDDDTGVQLIYLDENRDIQYYSRTDRNIKYEFNIKAEISDVKPQVDEMTVSSYDVFKERPEPEVEGTKQDLVDFLNEKMSMLTVSYADTSQVPEIFQWKSDEIDIKNDNGFNVEWNPKGGIYKVTQKYNDDFDISVTVNVTPVKLIDFTTDNQDITYWTGDADFPADFEQLNLAKKARPVLDTYIPNGGVSEEDIGWYSLESAPGSGINTLPDGFGSSDETYAFIGHLNKSYADFAADYLWLTVENPLPEIRIVRNVVTDEENKPKELELISSTSNDGILTIVVRNKDGSKIPENTVFDIKIPGGESIDTDALTANGKYTVTIDDVIGTATIVVSPDISIEEEKNLAQVINLGNRAGEFLIASTEPDKHKGPYVDCTPDPRRNIYLPQSIDNKNYEFDYSSLTSAMFPVKEGTRLPTTITLPRASDRINTTYSGYDGTVPGQLKTFTIDGDWTVVDGNPDSAGSIVEVTGTLADTSYTNYGDVANDDGITVTIKYYVTADDGKDSIEAIPDAMYDKRQEGYDYDLLQTKSFKVKNNGTTDIYGLSAVISLSKDNSKEAFVITKELPQILKSGESADLDITTKIGLLVLGAEEYTDYVCTVSILSENSKEPLQTFNISFTVTKKPTYNITITIDDDQKTFGSAKTDTDTYTALEGETVTVVAEHEEDCEFTGWTVVSGNVFFDDESAETTTFVMPGSDIEIKANFKELLGAKLRATELYVKDSKDVDQKLCDAEWKAVEFDPVKREYYVAVSNDTEQVKLWFKLRAEAENATLTLTHEHDPDKDTLAVPVKDTSDEYFKSQDIDLYLSPVDNIVTLSMTYDDPDDTPDEGEVTREYKIHIYRKIKTSELMTFNYGNSPYGLIMRDTALSDDDKAAYKTAFKDNGYKFTNGYTPAGGTQDLPYVDKAWNGKNYDLDEAALFVINDSPFTDPGYKDVINSIGGTVDIVSKKVRVNILDESIPSLQDGSSDDFVIIRSSSIDLPQTGQITELMSERIRPECYELTYSFTDFDNTVVEIKKPLIVLSALGDINVNGSANEDDASRIRHRFSRDLADNNNVPDYSDGGRLFRYRVCDVNKDGNVNAIDANFIQTSISPFYTNLLEGGGG